LKTGKKKTLLKMNLMGANSVPKKPPISTICALPCGGAADQSAIACRWRRALAA
jgi:hypothetical protein